MNRKSLSITYIQIPEKNEQIVKHNLELPHRRAKAPRAATPAIPIGLKVGAAPVDCAEAAELALEAVLEADLLALEAALLALEAALLALLDTEDEIWLADEAREERVWLADERAEEAELPVAVAAEAALVPDDAAVDAQEAAVGWREIRIWSWKNKNKTYEVGHANGSANLLGVGESSLLAGSVASSQNTT